MSRQLKQVIIIAISIAAGYFINTNDVQIEQTRSGLFVLHKKHIYQLFELSNGEPDFRESLKKEIKR